MAGDEYLAARAGEDHIAATLFRLHRFRDDVQLRILPDSLLIDSCIAGDRHIEIIIHAAHDHLLPVEHLLAIDTGELFREQALLDAIMIVEPGLRAPADVEGREDMGLGPLHDFRKLRPVLHLLERKLLDRRTGDNQTVEVLLLHLIQGHIEFIEMRGVGMLRLVGRHGHKGDLCLNREVRQYTKDIKLRILLQRHQVQDGDSKRSDLLRLRSLLIHHEDVLVLQDVLRW